MGNEQARIAGGLVIIADDKALLGHVRIAGIQRDAGARIIPERRQVDRALEDRVLKIEDIDKGNHVREQLFRIERKVAGQRHIARRNAAVSAGDARQHGIAQVDHAVALAVGRDMRIAIFQHNVLHGTNVHAAQADRARRIADINGNQCTAPCYHRQILFHRDAGDGAQIAECPYGQRTGRFGDIKDLNTGRPVRHIGMRQLHEHILCNARRIDRPDQHRHQRIGDVHDLQPGFTVGDVGQVTDRLDVDGRAIGVECRNHCRVHPVSNIDHLQAGRTGRDERIIPTDVDIVGVAGNRDRRQRRGFKVPDRDVDHHGLAETACRHNRIAGLATKDLTLGEAKTDH